MTISVYAIARDEAKHVRRWMASMKEADHVVVLDTGSADGTPELLREEGASVTQEEIVPWRFDAARNRSMELIPTGTDICVCTDLDEVFVPGWRAKLEEEWKKALDEGKNPTTATYDYVWNFREDGSEGSRFTYAKIHAPGVCRWTHPVHEVLAYHGQVVEVHVPGILLEHHADPTKSRAQYLDLLEKSVDEDPNDDRNVHYYGRELFFRGRYDEAIVQLTRHLSMPRATWAPERAASMRYIAQSILARGDYEMALKWWRRAIEEAPGHREAACEMQDAAYRANDWPVVVEAGEAAVRVQERLGDYLTKAECWGERPWDLLALGYHYSGLPVQAVAAARQAIKLAPEAEHDRLHRNLALMRAASLPVR